jgi:hypothetical protein
MLNQAIHCLQRLRLSDRSCLLAVFALLALLTACRSESPSEQLGQRLKTVSSWAATTQMVGEAWARDRVPTHYTRRTLQRVQQTLDEEMKTLGKSADIPPDVRSKVSEPVQKLKEIAGQMQRAVENSDRAAMNSQLEELKKANQEVNGIMKAGGTPQP